MQKCHFKIIFVKMFSNQWYFLINGLCAQMEKTKITFFQLQILDFQFREGKRYFFTCECSPIFFPIVD